MNEFRKSSLVTNAKYEHDHCLPEEQHSKAQNGNGSTPNVGTTFISLQKIQISANLDNMEMDTHLQLQNTCAYAMNYLYVTTTNKRYNNNTFSLMIKKPYANILKFINNQILLHYY
jgi:hypothetical protein